LQYYASQKHFLPAQRLYPPGSLHMTKKETWRG
jgi:hypothetical protein